MEDKVKFEETELKFDLHLDNKMLNKCREDIVAGIKHLELSQEEEFGLEEADEDTVRIVFGFGSIEVDKEVFFRQLTRVE